MTSNEFVLFSLQIACMLAVAVLFGELMRKFGQPAVLGEMIGGVILGPTIFAVFFPGAYDWLFRSSANVSMVRDASIKLGMLFFLFVAGAEINLADLKRLGRKSCSIGLAGTLLPIGIGVGLAYLLPETFWGTHVQAHFFSFALFLGMNLANSANPVIARILMDLNLLKKEFGTVVMSATIFDDLINWTLFAIILNNIAPAGAAHHNVGASLGLVLVFFVVVSVIGRLIARYAFQWIKANVSWPAGFTAATTLAILLSSCIAEKMGIHAFLGAFLIGAALGGGYLDSERNEIRDLISNFSLSFFAPIYFVSMGLTTNFIDNFDFALVSTVIAIAFISKIGGVMFGAWIAGMPLNRNTWAISFGLNARGATGIILAGIGLQYGLIDERIFVAMVVMAMVTSLVSGPMIKVLLKKQSI